MSYDVNTAQSLHEIRGLAYGLSDGEIERRVLDAGVDADRARWLVRQHRRFRILTHVRRIGLAFVTLGMIATITAVVLAVTDSSHAPSWLQFFTPIYVVLFGAIAASLRSMLENGRPLDLLRVNAIPPELAATPRNPILTGVFRRLLSAVLLLLVPALALMLLGELYPDIRLWSALRARGVETTGVIAEKRAHDRGRGVSYSIGYEFGRGTIIQGFERVDRSTYARMREGDPTPITYLPRNPIFSAPYRRADLTWPFLLANRAPPLHLLVMFTILPVLATLVMRTRRKLFDFYRTGTATLATITEADKRRLKYTYDTPAGTQNGFLLLRKRVRAMPAPGETIVVLYDTAKPRRAVVVAALDDVRFER